MLYSSLFFAVLAFILCLYACARVGTIIKATKGLDWDAIANITGDLATTKKTIQTLNFLLKKAVKIAVPKFPVNDADLTTIRHTSLRHHLEDDPSLGDRTRIVDFAKNALTSPEMLQKTYLDFISRESSLRESKSKMRSSNYSLVKRV